MVCAYAVLIWLVMSPDDVHEGMKVRDKHGEKLGRVARRLDDRFIVEKGFLLPKEVTVRIDQIAEIRDGVIWMRETGAQLEAESYAMAPSERGAPSRG